MSIPEHEAFYSNEIGLNELRREITYFCTVVCVDKAGASMFMDLLLKMLTWHPSNRLSAEDASNHQFFNLRGRSSTRDVSPHSNSGSSRRSANSPLSARPRQRRRTNDDRTISLSSSSSVPSNRSSISDESTAWSFMDTPYDSGDSALPPNLLGMAIPESSLQVPPHRRESSTSRSATNRTVRVGDPVPSRIPRPVGHPQHPGFFQIRRGTGASEPENTSFFVRPAGSSQATTAAEPPSTSFYVGPRRIVQHHTASTSHIGEPGPSNRSNAPNAPILGGSRRHHGLRQPGFISNRPSTAFLPTMPSGQSPTRGTMGPPPSYGPTGTPCARSQIPQPLRRLPSPSRGRPEQNVGIPGQRGQRQSPS